jgi:hypothetical protein
MKSVFVPLLIVAAGLSGAAIARAVTSGTTGVPDAQGVFHGCYQLQGASAGLLRVLPAADPCPAGTRAVTWNAQGRPGPTGPAGAVGPAGAQGAQGVTVGTAYSNSTSILGGTRGRAVASCPSGQHAIGGGGAFEHGAETGDAIVSSYPSDSSGSFVGSGTRPSAWTAAAYNGDVDSRSFEVWAVCSP